MLPDLAITASKARLLFFRSPTSNYPGFIRQHLEQHIKCLSLSFDVVLIEENCDYDELCGRYEPDLCLFESGVYTQHNRPRMSLLIPGSETCRQAEAVGGTWQQ